MDKMYYLNLATLLKTLATVSAVLTAELPDGVPGRAEPCKGYVRIHDNSIVMCTIVSNGNMVAEGQRALQFLRNHKAWYVSFSPDLLSNTEKRQALSSPSRPPQRLDITRPRPSVKEKQPYFPTLVQASPATEPIFQPSALSINASYSQGTEPLSQKELVSTMEQSSLYMSTRPKIPAANRPLIADSKVFQHQMALTSELMEKYNPKERLILRTVYAKINGQRRVDQLKEDLRLPAVTVERTLVELCDLGSIV